MNDIGIRELVDIGTADIDVYNTNRRKKKIKNDFKGTVEFYRSSAQSEKKLGAKDTLYTGQFGFDSYIKEHCPKGSVIYYLDEKGKQIENQEYNNYVCPYFSVWPPKIDKEKSKIILYVKASDGSNIADFLEYECKEWSPNSKTFSIATAKLKIAKESTETYNKKDYYRISITCTEAFENDISIEAKYGNNTIGRMIAKANAKVYETIIQPVLINFGDKASASVDLLSKHDEFVEKTFLSFFNKNSFNQCYIRGKLAEKTKSVTFSKDEFFTKELFYTEGKKIYLNRLKNADYNDLIEERFAAYNSGAQEKQQVKEELMDAAFEILTAFKKNFKYSDSNDLKKAKKFYEEKIATIAWKDPIVQNAYAHYKILKEKYTGENQVDKKNTTYVFYSHDLEASKYRTSVDKVRAFSAVSKGTVHAFNFALTANEIAKKSGIKDDKSEALIVHELGHAYGLSHTMDDKSAKKIAVDEAEIKNCENDIEKYLKLKKSGNEYEKYIRLDLIYCNIKDILNTKKVDLDIKNFESFFLVHFITEIKDKCWYYEGNEKKNIFDTIVLKMEENIEAQPVVLYDETETEEEKKEREEKYGKLTFDIVIQDRRNKINAYKKEIMKLQKTVGMVAEQSKTLENYMDYSQSKDVPEKPDTKNPNNLNDEFEYKSFYQWQWKIILSTGKKSLYISEIR